MPLKIVEETEWDTAAEVGYIQAAQSMRILYFNALAKWLALSGSLTDACASSVQRLSVYGHILICKCHRFTRAFPFLHKGPSWQPVLSLKYRMSAGRAGGRVHARQTDGAQKETIKRLFSAKISIVLKYLLLKVKLRLKSQHAVRVFYESRNY